MASTKRGTAILDSMLKVAHGSRDLQRIGTTEKELLIKIATLVPAFPPAQHEYEDAPEAPGHAQFDYCCDAAAVSHALANLNCDEFLAPLLGGRAYLEHVLECRYCQLLCGPSELSPDLEEEADKLQGEMLEAAKESRVEVDLEAETFKDVFLLPKKN
jgi:hypothetical protein